MTLAPERDVPCAHCAGSGRITLPHEVDTVEVYFFGCWREAGHYLIDPRNPGSWHEREITSRLPAALRHGAIDGRHCPGMRTKEEDRDRERRTRPEVEGEARLTHVEGWTVLGWWDRSVDKRGACNSNIIARGTHDFTTMLEIGRRRISHVMDRQKQTPRLVETVELPRSSEPSSEQRTKKDE